MAKQPKITPLDTGSEVVEDLHEVVEAEGEGVSYVDVTGKDDLPEGVDDVAKDADDEEKVPAQKTRKPTVKQAKQDDGDDVPAELKSKTPVELARMYRDAQQLIGRQGDELGKLREAADIYIRANLKQHANQPEKKVAEAKEPDEIDFFTDPKAAMAAAIANHPSVRELSGQAKQFATTQLMAHREASQAKFNAMHPDATEIVASDSFK